MQRSYAQAAATVAKHASEARLAKLVQDAATLYTTPGARSTCCAPLFYLVTQGTCDIVHQPSSMLKQTVT